MIIGSEFLSVAVTYVSCALRTDIAGFVQVLTDGIEFGMEIVVNSNALFTNRLRS